MIGVAFRLLGLLALLLPVWLGIWAVVCRHRRSEPAGESLLLSLACIPAILIVEMAVLGTALPGRPFDHLLAFQVAIDVGFLLLFRHGRRAAIEGLRDLGRGLIGAFREASWSQRVPLGIGLSTHLFSTAYGAWSVPWGVDELSYHVPQALQPLQDGRLGPVQADVIWADAYPRAVELIYSWTLILGSTDAGIHPVNAAFGVLAILATYVAARRIGLARGTSLVAAGLVPTAPLVFLLCVQGYIDLCVSASLAVGIAFALPRQDGSWDRRSLMASLLGLMMALWMKFSAVATVALVLTWMGLRSLCGTLRDSPGRGPHVVTVSVAFVAMLLLASVSYLPTIVKYGSPCYPIRLEVAGVAIFDGPMETAQFGRMNERSLAQRYIAYWTDWDDPLTSDSRGSFGPLFTVAFLVSALVGLVVSLPRPGSGAFLLSLSFWSVLAFPEHHVPRYASYILVPGAVLAAGLGERLPRRSLSRAWLLILVLLQLWNVSFIGANVRQWVAWQRGFGVPLFTEVRNRPILDRVMRFHEERGPSPRTRRELYARVRDGEHLVSAIHCLFALLYDPGYRYRVEHRPAKPWPLGHDHAGDTEFGRERAAEWHQGLLRDGVDALIVYQDSVEDVALREGRAFVPVYRQPAAEGKFPVVIYRRTD